MSTWPSANASLGLLGRARYIEMEFVCGAASRANSLV
jgi:hypothetical protein